MKLLSLSVFVYFGTQINAFQPASTTRNPFSLELTAFKNPMEGFLQNLANNFEPIHGHGSLEEDLDDEYESQQEILKERKRKNIDKSHLKKKYSDPEDHKSFDQNVGLQDNKPKKKPFWGKDVSP